MVFIRCVYFIFFDQAIKRFIPQDQLDTRVITHFILSVVCSVGFGFVYTLLYRKPFCMSKKSFRNDRYFAIFDLR